jgi:hypothetical protein
MIFSHLPRNDIPSMPQSPLEIQPTTRPLNRVDCNANARIGGNRCDRMAGGL